MSEQVGSIEYVASIDLAEFIRNQRDIDTRLGSLEKSGGKLEAAMTKVASAVKILAAGYAVLQTVKMADDMRLLAARVNVVSGSVEDGTKAWQQLVAISSRTQTAMSDNVSLFTRLNAAIKELGGTQTDTLRITELVSKAIKVSGSTAAEASAAQLQFAQALGSGKLAGDELKSLMETSPYLMRQLADSLGVPIGALKKLGADGELTADKIVNALGNAATRIEADFARLPQTLEGAMTVARDAAGRAALKFDELAGTSSVLSGTVKGVADVLERLAIQFGMAAGEAERLGKDRTVKTWADGVSQALSYVVDVVDVTWQTLSVLGRNVAFVFQGIGTEIGGIGAQVAAVMRGDFAGARAIGEEMKAEAAQRRKDLDEADAKTLARTKTFGQQMRQAWAAPQASYSNEGRVAAGGTTAMTPGPGSGGGEKAKKFTFDAEAYLSSLKQANMQGLALIDERESAELAKNRKLLAEKKIDLLQYTQAVYEIEAKAVADRSKLHEQERGAAMAAAEANRRRIEDEAKARAEADAAEAAKQQQGQAVAIGIIGDSDPVAKLQFELEAKSALLAQFAEQDMANLALYAQAKVALEQQTQDQISAIVKQRHQNEAAMMSMQLQNYSNLFGSLADITKTFAGEQSGVYKAMFAVSKAFAIADAVMKIQQGIANAMSLPWPANLAAAASTASAAAGIVSTIRGTSFGGGRQYGGPVDAGTMYRVNETGKPEMYTAASGEQYMLPTKNGKVTPANRAGADQQSQRHAPAGDVYIPLTGIPMPDGWFAIRPDQLADAIKRARRDGHLAELR